jgi:hypothetical protein
MHLVQTVHLLYPLLIHILLLIEWTKNLEGAQYRYLSRIFMLFLHKTEEKNIHVSWDGSVCLICTYFISRISGKVLKAFDVHVTP